MIIKIYSAQFWRWLLSDCIFDDFSNLQKKISNHKYLEKMSLKVLTSFAIHRKRIFHALKKIMMQLQFNSNTLSDDRYGLIRFKIWEKSIFRSTLTFDLQTSKWFHLKPTFTTYGPFGSIESHINLKCSYSTWSHPLSKM